MMAFKGLRTYHTRHNTASRRTSASRASAVKLAAGSREKCHMEYIRRIVDQEIDKRIKAFNAINIIGPKGSGKTRTAQERCKTIIEFQDEERRDGYLAVAETAPRLFSPMISQFFLMNGRMPLNLGAIRKDVMIIPGSCRRVLFDRSGPAGKQIHHHTGTGRISELIMYPMTLWETGESNGAKSLCRSFLIHRRFL